MTEAMTETDTDRETDDGDSDSTEFPLSEKAERVLDVLKEERGGRASPYLIRLVTGYDGGEVDTALKQLMSVGAVRRPVREGRIVTGTYDYQYDPRDPEGERETDADAATETGTESEG